jgi:hypothetical protein
MTTVTEYKSQGFSDFVGAKPWAALDILNHGFQWMKGSAVFVPFVEAQNVLFAASDACVSVEDAAAVASKTIGCLSGKASTSQLVQSARKVSVSTGNFLSSFADAVSFASTAGIMKAIPGISFYGNVAGIWSKSIEIYDSYGNYANESAKPDNDAKELKKKNIMFDILFRTSIIAIKMLALAPIMIGMTFSSSAFLVTSTVILTADLGAYYFDVAHKNAITP